MIIIWILLGLAWTIVVYCAGVSFGRAMIPISDDERCTHIMYEGDRCPQYTGHNGHCGDGKPRRNR